MNRRLPAQAVVLALAGCLAATIRTQEGPREAGEAALKDRDFAKASRLLSQVLAEGGKNQDEILYLLATAQQNEKRYDAAIGTLDRLLREHPASPLRMKAVFRKADVVAARGDFEGAAAGYDGQVAALTAAGRRKTIAMVYVDAGRESLHPKDPKDPTFVPNYPAAHKLLAKSLELEALGEEEEAVRADLIACELKGNLPRPQLLKSCETFREKFPKSAKLDEVLFAEGAALRDLGRPWEAKKTWLRLAAEFAASKRAPEGLLAAAQIHVAPDGRTSSVEELRRALPLLRRITKDFPQSEQGPLAAFTAAVALAPYEDLRDDARRDLAAFADAHPRDERAPEALLRAAQLHRADQNDAAAIATLEDFLKRFPDSPRWPEVRQQIADVRFERAQRAFARKDWPAARAAAQEFTELHPTDGRAPLMAFRAGETLKEEKKFREAVEAWMKVASKYPNHDVGHQARYAAAALMAAELDEFETALKELPKVGGSRKAEAQALLQKLQGKALAVQSERVFRSDEAPKIKLTSRNLESVKLKLWVLDLKDYFEKKASTSGLQALEVAVIAPDKEWDHAVKDYKRFKETQLEVDLPQKDPGAYVVTASAGTLEATTVVVVSDLALIARAGRKAARVLVQNQRTGEVAADATVRTAADGRHLKGWTKETAAQNLSFLAESKGHLAFRDLSAEALPLPPERVPAALVLTDRRLYAPEDEVRVRLFVRDAVDGVHAGPKDKKYRVAAVSAQGVAFFETELALSRAGAAGTAFRLLPGLTGAVRVDVFEVGKPQDRLVGQAAATVTPAAPRTPSFDFLMEDKTWFVGDDVDVTVVLRDAWGRPMPGRRVQVITASDNEYKDRLSGPDGTFVVQLRETEQHYARGSAAISVVHEGAQDVHVVPLHSRGILLSFEEASRVTEPVLSGEEKTLHVLAKRADDTPAAGRLLKYSVVRQNEAGERLPVASGEVTTDAAGKARVTIRAAEGGIHTVALSFRDEDGMPTRLQTALRVVDDKDDQKLRLLSGADEFEPGKPLEFAIFSRLEKGLAFVTVEGETIDQVLPVTLEKGRNAVRLGPPPLRTRDFTVAVLMMQAGKFHADVRDFRLKAPEIALEAEKKEYRPGDEATVKVVAKPGSEVFLIAAEHVTASLDADAFTPRRPGAHFTGDSSAATAFAWETRQLDDQLVQALANLDALNEREGTRVMLETRQVLLPQEGARRELENLGQTQGRLRGQSDLTARGGGGGGGQYGSRLGGKRILRPDRPDPEPLLVASSEVDANGTATFRFRLPQGWGQYTVSAWAVDASNQIAAKSIEIKARAPVTVEFRAPESAVEGEKTSVVALLTNHSAEERPVTLTIGEADTAVRVPPRSTLETVFPWVAAASVSLAADGVRQDRDVALRPAGPVAHLEAGGAFAARTELKVDGPGRLRVRYATGPEALLESLAEGRDPLANAGDAAARLIALVARHRYAKTEATKRAVMEFSARRAAGLADAAELDASWPVLLYLAAAEAKAAEFEMAPNAAVLKQRFAQAVNDDVKSLMVFALARGGEAQYGYIHRLWRSADQLSPRAIAAVALALKAVSKPDEAKAALERLVKAAKDDHWEAAPVPVPDGSNTTYGATALGAFALAEIDPAHALLPRARAWLLARSPSTPFERAMLALAMQSTPDRSAVKELRVDGRVVTGFGEVAVTNAVVEPEGAGTFYALARRETAQVPDPPVKVAVKRTARWPALVIEGMTVPAAPVAVKEPVENPSMARVAAGQSTGVTYELTVAGPTTRYHVVELPRTTGLREDPRALRVLVPPQAEAERKVHVRVPVYADLPGAYPEIEVLAAGADFRAGWQITHAERLGAGRILYEKKKWKEAKEALAPLFEKGTLLDPPMIEAARMLAYGAIELGEQESVVRYFEILKEKSPAEIVPFDRIRAVGRAYSAMKEHERAMQVHAGTCDAYFLQEANVVGALDDLGRTRPGAEWMKRLLLDHPDTALNREMLFGFGQRLYSRAAGYRDPAEKDEKRLTRAEMLAESAGAFERWLAWHPGDKEADEVSLSLGAAYLEAQKHDLAARAGRDAAGRFPKSKHLDSYDYIQAVALFARKQFAEALVLCDRLESFDYSKQANPGPAVMRDQAALMKAQIFHAKGELDKALENYKKVREKSPDAARSIAFLEREAIAVPEVTLAPLAKPAEVDLEYAGVAEAHVRAYKVNLTMLALRRKGLADAAAVEVAGIRPVLERTVKLGHPNARRREREKLALDLKEPGAYLVGVKAGDFFASGIVLRSDLTMTVQEEPGGRVRVNIANAATGGFEEGVKVTIFGTTDAAIRSEKTDLRGIWESTIAGGAAIVVGEKNGHVAMFRGQTVHQPPPPARAPAAPPTQEPALQKEQLQDYLKNLNEEKEKRYGDNVMKQQEGVEVERTKK